MAPVGSAAFGAAVSEHPEPVHGVAEAVGAVLEAVGPSPDIAVVFVTRPHLESLADIVDVVSAILDPAVLIGTTATAVIGGPSEVEDAPGISVFAGRTGEAEAVRLEVVRSPDGTAVVGMPDGAAVGRRTLLLLADPYSFPTEAFVQASNAQYPNLTVIGGMASAGGPGVNRLIVQGEIHHEGAVGVLLPEGFETETVVSQGCRPVGDPFTVTSAEGNVVRELGSQPALDRLQSVVDEVDEHDRVLLSSGLHVGLVVDESSIDYGPGDFLIRGVVGADHATGELRVGDRVPVGTTLQFQVRDAASADADLANLLGGTDADAALVFSCNGRGSALFGTPGHDAEMVSESVRGGAVAGMFCAGEIGPVRNENHVHGFTAAVLLFYG